MFHMKQQLQGVVIMKNAQVVESFNDTIYRQLAAAGKAYHNGKDNDGYIHVGVAVELIDLQKEFS